mgnify:FL=1
MNIYYKDIVLRAIEETDLGMLKDMMNDPEIENMTGGYSYPVSSFQQKLWFENLRNRDNEIRLIIDTEEHGAIGIVMLTNIDWKNRSAQSHSKIANGDFRGKGYGTMASTALVKYAFEELNLHCIYSHVIEYNEASKRVREKIGFIREGILRDRIYKKGEYHNVEVWSILNKAFKNNQVK